LKPAVDVSVVVPYYNDPGGLAQLYAALARQTAEPKEIVVVDDGSPAARAAASVPCGELERVRVVVQRNAGAATARNAGAALATAPVVAFVDSDCVPDPDWLERTSRAVEDGLAIAYGRVYSESGYPYPLWTAPGGQALISASLVVRNDAFAALGGFDGAFVGYREDTDFGLRAEAMNLSLGCAVGGATYHPVRRQGLRKLWHAGMLHRNDPLLLKRHGPGVFADLGLAMTKPAIPPGFSPAGIVVTGAFLGAVACVAGGRAGAAVALVAGVAAAMCAGTLLAGVRAGKRRTRAEIAANALAGVPYLCGWYAGRVSGSIAHRTLCL